MKDLYFIPYLAGFIDADGSIGIVASAKTRQYIIQIAACNCCKEPIMALQNKFGGKLRTRNWKNKNWKPNHEWKLTSCKALTVIEQIYPYLMIKRRQAEIAIEAQKLKSKYSQATLRWHPEIKKERDIRLQELKEECAQLNKRGLQ